MYLADEEDENEDDDEEETPEWENNNPFDECGPDLSDLDDRGA